MSHEYLTFFKASTCRVQLCRMDRDDNVRHQNDLINQRLTWLRQLVPITALLPVADNPGVGPSMTTSAFLLTYLSIEDGLVPV